MTCTRLHGCRLCLFEIIHEFRGGIILSIESFFSLLGGLALFLYGMQMMSTNLEAAAGSRMKQILERLTANRFLGVLVGAGITAIIQSSSATTVMVVGFVNSQIMTLKQAVWIIMGANIGTTITGQLIALDIGAIAPLIAFVGVALILFVKKKKVQFAGGIVAGLGILFLGMGMMSAAMIPLRNSEGFVRLMTRFSNPLLGILAGAGLYSHHPVLIRVRRNPAGPGCQRAYWNRQRCICSVWSEYRHLYHGRAGLHRCKQGCKTHHPHPPDV